jgi:hypothetical protein
VTISSAGAIASAEAFGAAMLYDPAIGPTSDLARGRGVLLDWPGRYLRADRPGRTVIST